MSIEVTSIHPYPKPNDLMLIELNVLFLYLDVIDDAVMDISLVWKVTTHHSNSLLVSNIIVYTNWLLGFDN